MATLHLRNVPEDLDAALTQDAAAHGTSKNKRAIQLLARALGRDHAERVALVERIRRNRAAIGDIGPVDVAALIRDGRPGGDD